MVARLKVGAFARPALVLLLVMPHGCVAADVVDSRTPTLAEFNAYLKGVSEHREQRSSSSSAGNRLTDAEKMRMLADLVTGAGFDEERDREAIRRGLAAAREANVGRASPNRKYCQDLALIDVFTASVEQFRDSMDAHDREYESLLESAYREMIGQMTPRGRAQLAAATDLNTKSLARTESAHIASFAVNPRLTMWLMKQRCPHVLSELDRAAQGVEASPTEHASAAGDTATAGGSGPGSGDVLPLERALK